MKKRIGFLLVSLVCAAPAFVLGKSDLKKWTDLHKGPAGPTRALLCSPTSPCPTMPPVLPTIPKQTVFCNLGVDCFQACEALIEDLWVSGCTFFPDCGELVFTAQQFGAHYDESCTSIINDSEAPPYLMAAVYDVFVDGIHDGGPSATSCRSHLVARELRPSFDVGGGTILSTEALPFIDFCISEDFDETSFNGGTNIEIDLCFIIPFDSSPVGPPARSVQFRVCHETAVPGAAFVTSAGTNDTDIVEVTNTQSGDATFNHYTATVCLSAGDVAVQVDNIMRLEILRLLDAATFNNFPLPIFLTSITFRYPRIPCPLSRLDFCCTGLEGCTAIQNCVTAIENCLSLSVAQLNVTSVLAAFGFAA